MLKIWLVVSFFGVNQIVIGPMENSKAQMHTCKEYAKERMVTMAKYWPKEGLDIGLRHVYIRNIDATCLVSQIQPQIEEIR